MSVLFGIFYRDGRTVTDEPETMYSGLRHFPHERHAFLKKGNCAFGHMLTCNTPEAAGEAMPRWIEGAHLMFVAEGRIDNRDELFEALGSPPAERTATPDGDLILAAYRKWGEKCVDHLLGKWSLAAFHTDEQRLFVARDKWDYTAVDYYADDRVFIFATSARALLNLPFVPRKIDELMIARLLVAWPGDFEKTYYSGILRLLPSQMLRVTRESMIRTRYWNYEDIPVREGLGLEDYCGDLFDKLNKAVAARLRSYKPVCGTLSGGLDSSTVCYLAAEHMARQGKRLHTYTHVPHFNVSPGLPGNRFGNERPFVEAIVAASGNIDPAYLDSGSGSPLRDLRESLRISGEVMGNAGWLDLYRKAYAEGYGTLLTGDYGNATISWTGSEDRLSAAELLRRRGIRCVARKKLATPLLFGNHSPGRLYRRIRFGKRPWASASFSSEAFEHSLYLARRMRESGYDPVVSARFPGTLVNRGNILAFNIARLCQGAVAGCATGIELRDPASDVRVMESALSIPDRFFLGPMNKWVLRTMMKDRLPDVVRLNIGKSRLFADLPMRLVAGADEVDRLFSQMRNSRFGQIVDLERAHRTWAGTKADPVRSYSGTTQLLRMFTAYLQLGEELQQAI
jgi:asparagine synthase (glutamine-hydrolysing)